MMLYIYIYIYIYIYRVTSFMMVETDIGTSAAASPISKLCMMRPSKRTLLLSLVMS